MTLFRQHFRAQSLGLIIWVGVSFILAYATGQTAPAFVEKGDITALMKGLPAGMASMYGSVEGISPADAFVAVGVNKSLGLLAVLYAVLQALSVVTREVDRRSIDFLLSLPVERDQILTSRVAVITVNSLLQTFAMWGALCFTMARAGVQGAWGEYAWVFVNVWLIAIAMAGITLLASLWVDDYGLGVKLFLGVSVGTYILELSLRGAMVSRWARILSPFSYLDPPEVFRLGHIPWANGLVLLVIAGATIGLSYPAFRKKQITV